MKDMLGFYEQKPSEAAKELQSLREKVRALEGGIKSLASTLENMPEYTSRDPAKAVVKWSADQLRSILSKKL